MNPIHWAAVLMYAALIAVGVESVQEKDVSSIVLVVVSLIAMTVFVQIVGNNSRSLLD